MATAVKIQSSEFRKILLKKRKELLASTSRGPEALATIVQSPDEVEFAVGTLEQDVTAATASLRSRELKEIENALQRLAGGTYGECEACGEPISSNRLKALPWARYCLSCQDKRSRN